MNRSTAVGTSAPAAANQRLLAIITSTPATNPSVIGTSRSTSCSLGSSSTATAENTTPAAKWSNALASALPCGRTTAAHPPTTIAATGISVQSRSHAKISGIAHPVADGTVWRTPCGAAPEPPVVQRVVLAGYSHRSRTTQAGHLGLRAMQV
jgi:hypothetical protein